MKLPERARDKGLQPNYPSHSFHRAIAQAEFESLFFYSEKSDYLKLFALSICVQCCLSFNNFHCKIF